MPKFLNDLTPQDWFKIAGLTVMGTLLYADVHSSIEKQEDIAAMQAKRIADIEHSLKAAINNQSQANKEISEQLGGMNQKLGVIGESARQLEERTKRIERKL